MRSPSFWVFVIPKLLLLLVTWVRLLPLPFPGITKFMPMIDAACVFFWAIHVPSALPLWWIAMVGLLSDSISGAPLALTVLVNGILFVFASHFRRYFYALSLELQWLMWGLVAAGAQLLTMTLYAFHSGAWVGSYHDAFLQWVLTVLLFPAFYAWFNAVYRWFPSGWFHAE